ncbi:MAG: DUF3365 domain-containing protein, partial [Acetobacteraceae bacterium]|nr:DUF3365 domain-containing protein [Acetobacteraceae bacterium]
RALAALRRNPGQKLTKSESSLFSDRVHHIMPVVMEAPCVACHNSHPDSPKRDWKVGDVRGIQEVTVSQPIVTNLLSLRHLLIYLRVATAAGCAFITLQWRQATAIVRLNRELEKRTRFLASISSKISRYISPQIFESIFNGERDASIHTQRKKLTIFFSDIEDFTGLTLSMQPEEIAALLNDYLTEMSAIALKRGGTVDKFIGDAILVFFGDPQSWGTQEDAQACLRMAGDMQRRLSELNVKWRQAGIETAAARAHGHRHRLLQRRQLRQRQPHGLHGDRRRSEPGGAPAGDRRARRHRHELRDLCSGSRPGGRPPAAPVVTGGCRPRGDALRRRALAGP